jgi:hypothetical protein
VKVRGKSGVGFGKESVGTRCELTAKVEERVATTIWETVRGGGPDPEDAVRLPEPWPLGRPLEHDKLLAQSQVLHDQVGFLREKSTDHGQ